MDDYITQIIIGSFGTLIVAMGVLLYNMFQKKIQRDDEEFEELINKYDELNIITRDAFNAIREVLTGLENKFNLEEFKIQSLSKNYEKLSNVIENKLELQNKKLDIYGNKITQHELDINILKKKINGSL